MAPSVASGDASQEIQSGVSHPDRASTVACDGERLKPGSSAPTINDESRSPKAVISLAVIAISAIVMFECYRLRRYDLLGSQAIDVGETFIRSSPVVEQDLGSVQTVEELGEAHHSNPPAGWYVNFDVSGKRRSGVVEMRLRHLNGQWQVPSAELKIGLSQPVNLR